MSKIDQQFKKINKENRIGLMTHIVLGYPSFQENIETVKLMEKGGVDFIELQLPFSDPVADGPTMMKANTKSLEYGTKIKKCFQIAKKITNESSIPILFMTYLNIAFQYGVKKFVVDATKAGIVGSILPDLPFEEADEYVELCKKKSINPIFVVSPNTSAIRMKQLKKDASGFVYCTTRTGVTGVQKTVPSDVKAYLRQVKNITKLPIAVGFGIAKKAHVQALKGVADCAVIGSALMKRVHEGKTKKERLRAIKTFLSSF